MHSLVHQTTRIHRRFLAPIALTLGLVVSPASAAETLPSCDVDLDGSGAVDGADLGALIGVWGSCPGCEADLNDDGIVDAADLGLLLGAWGPLPTLDYGPEYPDAEAWQIALEMLGSGGPLTVPAAIYERVDRDLDLIRAFEPALANQGHTLAWAPNQVIVKVLDSQPTEAYDCLNAFFQLVEAQEMFKSGGGTLYLLHFPGKVNVPALAAMYESLDVIEFAEPNGLIGGQNFWVPTMGLAGVWTWTIDDGFHDCFDGCDCHNYYTFTVDAEGSVTLVSYEQVGAPWCDFS